MDYDGAVKEIISQLGVTVSKRLRSAVFNGVSIQATKSSPETLQDLPQVVRAWRSNRVKLLPSVDVTAFSDGAEAANYSVNGMCGVDKVHASGVYGKGVKVAVVDTGVDYTHPAVSRPSLGLHEVSKVTQSLSMPQALTKRLQLGGGFGPGFKVAGGYDVVGNGGMSVLD